VLKNALLFDGVHEELKAGHILVRGSKIERVVHGAADVAPKGDREIDCGGSVITPGFIDIHTHVMLCMKITQLETMSNWEIGIRATKNLERMLLRGFTTIRDAGGADGSMASLCAEGVIAGPRIFPCCRMMSQTGGHFDFRRNVTTCDGSCPCLCGDAINLRDMAFIVDGKPAMLQACRLNFKYGATQLKVAVGGGAASPDDPLHTVQFTAEEVRTAVECAENWGTYVMAHCYTDAGARLCIEAGVKSIEHGHLLSEESVKRCQELCVVISTQFVVYKLMYAAAREVGMSEAQIAKFEALNKMLYNIAGLIKKYNIKTGFGTDIIGPERMHEQQNMEFALRKEAGFSNFEILRQATSESAEIIQMCGPLNPCGKFGVIEEGALADLLVHARNPMEDVSVLLKHEEQLRLVMKDGKIFKNAFDA